MEALSKKIKIVAVKEKVLELEVGERMVKVNNAWRCYATLESTTRLPLVQAE